MELLLVIVILAIVGAGTMGFISTGTKIFIDGVEREQLVADSRFVIERLSREVRNALPNSQRVAKHGSDHHCLEFVPCLNREHVCASAFSWWWHQMPPRLQQEVEAIEILNDFYQPPRVSE